MASYEKIEYYVVTGTIAAIATFNAAVETQLAAGYAPILEAQSDGTNIWQTMIKVTGSAFTEAYPITVATMGVAGSGSFTIAGDHTSNFNAGFKFTVVDSTGNDATYSVKNGGSSYAGGNTTIPVNEAVVDATADGLIISWSAV